MSYGELDRAANRIGRALVEAGVGPGDRVGIWLEKSPHAVAAMQGALRIGAAYVPLDPFAPPSRIRGIVRDCGMAAVVTTSGRAEIGLVDDLAGLPALLVPATDELLPDVSSEPLPVSGVGGDDLAYILYTSGSTGTPKGVCISHRNSLAFVEWAHGELAPSASDRFSNHAPFHFDLSVLDLYVAFMAGASVVLIPDGLQYLPSRLVELIATESITIWYSVPSALILMIDQGGLLDRADIHVRAWLFAGEPFPIQHLRRLFTRFEGCRFLNLYGPTETNVCTFFEVTEIPGDRLAPVPIGKACSGDEVWAVADDGRRAGAGEVGELMVAGPTVMLGYWGRQAQGVGPYATGDVVRFEADGNYAYLGRRDHLVKVRGHRIELGEVEATLTAHDAIGEVAVVVVGSGVDARLVAYAVLDGEEPPTLLEIKRHCAERLPRYMIVDAVRFVPELPRTRNGKVDRAGLIDGKKER
jgi:amino acid adenylation domain-containing protein